jgi:hypothetical protein
MPAARILNERLGDQKFAVLGRLAWKPSRKNDGDQKLHHVF